MGSRFCCFIVLLALQIVSSVTSRPFASNHDDVVGLNQTESSLKPGSGSGSRFGSGKEEQYARGMGRIGSSPPSCEHKCYGCDPCEAIQVPTVSKSHKRFGVEYTNYEPEGWKCKCGSSVYSP